MYPKRAPITEAEREYTRSGHQSQKGRENIPGAGANHRRGERMYRMSIVDCLCSIERFRSGTRKRRFRTAIISLD
eukprot:4513044-Pyramimonas_sp.AAC.1